ncbi:MAG: beta-propeller fold lactonase family protein [Planctomycetota bacterium]
MPHGRMVTGALIAVATGVGAEVVPTRPGAAPFDFQGTALVSVSDADMLASAYVDGVLGPRQGRDALSVIDLAGGHPRDFGAAEVEVTNSVAGPAVAVDVSPDGRHAFVVETFRPRPDDGRRDHTFADLHHGNVITVVDLGDLSSPRVVQRLEIGERPESVSVNADGSMVAVAFHPDGDGGERPLAIIPFRSGRLGAPIYPALPGADGQRRVVQAEWHPSRDVLALVDAATGSVRFVTVAESGAVEVSVWGNEVVVGKFPFMARFTPDGGHLIVTNLYWGADVEGFYNEAPRGDLGSIRLGAETGEDGSVRHALVSRAMVGPSPEGFAISPDGQWVVTADMHRSWLPWDDERATFYSSLTLVHLDQSSGQLTAVGTFPYEGLLPEALAFDSSSRYLAVVNYDSFDDRVDGGSVDFWRLAHDPMDPNPVAPVLVRTRYSVPVTHGPHSMVLVP